MTKKSFIFLSVFFWICNTTLLTSQNFGIGTSFFAYSFQHENKEQFSNWSYQPSLSNGIGGQFLFNWKSTEAFQLRLASNIHRKVIKFNFDNSGLRGKTPSIQFFFTSIDFKVIGQYLLYDDTKRKILPRLGFSLRLQPSFNIVSSNSSNGQQTFIPNLPSFLDIGIITGIAFHPATKLLNREIEFTFDLNYSPRSFFNVPLEFQSEGQRFNIQGHYHYFALSFNIFLKKVSKTMK